MEKSKLVSHTDLKPIDISSSFSFFLLFMLKHKKETRSNGNIGTLEELVFPVRDRMRMAEKEPYVADRSFFQGIYKMLK